MIQLVTQQGLCQAKMVCHLFVVDVEVVLPSTALPQLEETAHMVCWGLCTIWALNCSGKLLAAAPPYYWEYSRTSAGLLFDMFSWMPNWNKDFSREMRCGITDHNFCFSISVQCGDQLLTFLLLTECFNIFPLFIYRCLVIWTELNQTFCLQHFNKYLCLSNKSSFNDMCHMATLVSFSLTEFCVQCVYINPYPTAFPYGNGMVLHFYQQQESSTTKTVHKVINKRLKTYV